MKRSFITGLEGNAPVVRVPIETNDAPNVFVSVTLLRGYESSPKQFQMPEYRFGYCPLRVENSDWLLQLTVRPSATDYRPGDTVQVVTEVADMGKHPVAGAEVTLYAVDEGILSLTGYELPDPYTLFNQPRPLGVRNGLSLLNVLPEDPEELQFHNKGYLIGGGGRSGERLRKNFLACAFWKATMLTDSNGTVSASFTAPDSLTRYRVIAVAHTAHSQFGSAESAFEINKPLMIEPALPRFANLTDRIIARAVVLNQTDHQGDIAVTLQLDDKAVVVTNGAAGPPVSQTLSQTVRVAAHGSTVVEFPLQFVQTGTAQWIWRACFAQSGIDSFTDAVQSTLPVGYIAPLLSEIHLAREKGNATNLLASANPQLLEGRGTVTVSIANTRLVQLAPAISHLLHYPYGCIEQTSSSLLPWIVLNGLPGLAPFLEKPPAEMEKVIRTGIERLFSMQTSAGGLSYWPGGREPSLWGSAYGGMILALAKRRELAGPDSDFERLLNYLSQQMRDSLTSRDSFSLNAHCLALYTLALAGRAEPAYQEKLFQIRSALSAENRSLLALAILESRGPAAMVEELLNSKLRVPGQQDDWFDCDARDLAMQLLAWTRYRPADPVVDVLVAELMRTQTEGHWSTTQGNAWAVYALTEYAARVEGQLQPASGQVVWGKESEPFELGTQAAVTERAFPLTPQSGKLPLAIKNPSGHPLYLETKIEARSTVAHPPRQDRGFSVERTYARVSNDGSVQPDLKGLRVGDSVVVTLHLVAHQASHYVAIDDPLPAVLQAITPAFKSRQSGADQPAMEDFVSDFHELRNDRALFFRDDLPAGSYTVRYLARVCAAGTATAPAAKVEEMYHPDHFGITETKSISSLSLE